jgi:FdhD protein
MKAVAKKNIAAGKLGNKDVENAAVKQAVELWSDQKNGSSVDYVATEIAVALVYNGISHAVMMASPLQLEAFALGFSLTEGIIESAEDVYQIQVDPSEAGIEVSLTISSQCFNKLKNKRRSLSGRTGCGICGAESLQQIRLPVPKVVADFFISHVVIDQATRALTYQQPLQGLTGAIHGAAWCDANGNLLQVCEDVGRHNALDKLIGLLWPQQLLGNAGFLLMSSRASYEILQKAAMVNIGIVVAISAPTSLAIEIANQAGITLVGFSRENRHIAYTNPQRLVP